MRVGDLLNYRNGARYRVIAVTDAEGKLDPPVVVEKGKVVHFAAVLEGAEGQPVVDLPLAPLAQLPGEVTKVAASSRAGYVVEFFDWLPQSPYVASFLNRFPEVKWDRFTEGESGMEVYGWIERDDDRSDFLVLEFDFPARTVGFTTSSASLSEEFNRRLYGDTLGHVECQRVEDRFGELVSNFVSLSGKSE